MKKLCLIITFAMLALAFYMGGYLHTLLSVKVDVTEPGVVSIIDQFGDEWIHTFE